MTKQTKSVDPLIRELSAIDDDNPLKFETSYSNYDPDIYPFDFPKLRSRLHQNTESPKNFPAITLRYQTESGKNVGLGLRENLPFEPTAIGYYRQGKQGDITPLSNQQIVEIIRQPDFVEKVQQITKQKDDAIRAEAEKTGNIPAEEQQGYYLNFQERYTERFFDGTERFANNLYKVTSCGVNTCNSEDGQELFVNATQCYGCGHEVVITAAQNAKGEASISTTKNECQVPLSHVDLLGNNIILDDPDNKDPNNFIVPHVLQIAKKTFDQNRS